MEHKKYRVLKTQKQYLKLLFADLISRFGDSLDVIAYSWIMYEITGSESLMALIIGINYIPTVLLQPFAGALADRIKKKNLMAITDILRFMLVAAFILLYSGGLLTPLLIAVLTICTSTVEAFRMPAGNAVLPMILESEYYTVGKAASYSLSRVSQLVGFVLAGGLIALIGSAGVLWIDAVTFAVSAVIISTMKVKDIQGNKKIYLRRIFTDFKEGVLFLKKNKTMQIITLIGIVINFGLMPLSAFQTPYVSDYLQMGPEILSYIKILMIVGMMTGAAVAPKLINFSKAKIDMAAGIGMGIAIICMYITAVVEIFAAAMILLTLSMFFVGVGGGILNVIDGSCMMKAVPKEAMGRVSGLHGSIMEASMPIGSFLCSALVLKINVIQVFLLFGALTVLFYTIMGLAHKFDSLDEL
ncbi:MAG: MFS transporter [Bacteroides sp.]|nr:MFS transporter [Bacteroides sp.]